MSSFQLFSGPCHIGLEFILTIPNHCWVQSRTVGALQNTHKREWVCVSVCLCTLHRLNLLLFSHPTSWLAVLNQMFTSLTSVGVVERSCPSLMFLVSSMVTELLGCCACLRLVSSKDSICSWQALRQSWKVRVLVSLMCERNVYHVSMYKSCHGQMYPPGHSWWSVLAAQSVSETSWHCRPFSSVSPPLQPPYCLLLPWTEGWLWI